MKNIYFIKGRIDDFVQDQLDRNRFFCAARQGEVHITTLYLYLNNLRYLVEHTPIQISEAIQEAKKLEEYEIAEFLEEKLQEEVGHDRWGDADLEYIRSITPLMTYSDKVLSTMDQFISHNIKRIYHHPKFYLIHVFFAEYFTVAGGPEILNRLCLSTGVSPSRMSIIANHIELDKKHVNTFLSSMEQLFENGKRKEWDKELQRSFHLFNEFTIELMEEQSCAA